MRSVGILTPLLQQQVLQRDSSSISCDGGQCLKNENIDIKAHGRTKGPWRCSVRTLALLCRPTQRSPSARFSRRVESPIPQYGSFFSIWAFPALHSAILSWLALRSLLSMQLVSTLMQWWDGGHQFFFFSMMVLQQVRAEWASGAQPLGTWPNPRCRGLRMQQLDGQQA